MNNQSSPLSVSSKPRSRARRMLRGAGRILFYAVALILVGICARWGLDAAQSVARIADERSIAEARAPLYAGTATAIAEVTVETSASVKDVVRMRQVFATNTPQGDPAAQTPTPAAPTPEAQFTLVPPALEVPTTPRPLPTLYIYSGPEGSSVAPTAIPVAVEALDRQGNDLINIVLLGNDGEITGDTVSRTDTMIILSVNRTTNTVALLSLPRDLYVYIPSWTMQRINVAYPYGESVGWTDGGFGLLRQTLFYNFGINVHYYAMVNLTGFKAIVDSVGGVDLAVDCAIQDLPLVSTELPSEAYRVTEDGEYALPVGFYHLDGAQALWYARSRSSSSDFDRGPRQQQVIRAVWRQARANGLLGNLPQLWAEGSPYIETNLTFEDIVGLLPVAANLDPAQIEQFSLVRTYHTTPWQTPDGDYVQLPNPETLRQLMQDFYTPPTESQVSVGGATVNIYNGTGNASWDGVAASALGDRGFEVMAMGSAPTTDYVNTVLIDYTGRTKGSSLEEIAATLNVNPNDIRIEPRADRTVDFEVFLGSSYNSCNRSGVLAIEPPLEP